MPDPIHFAPAQAGYIAKHSHGRALEFGTGSCRGTHALLAAGCDPIHTIDEDENWTLAANARIIATVLFATHHELVDKANGKFYDFTPVDLYDTVIIDGPLTAAYRKHALHVIADHLTDTGWDVIFRAESPDSGKAIITEWLQEFPVRAVKTDCGMWHITQEQAVWRPDEWEGRRVRPDNHNP